MLHMGLVVICRIEAILIQFNQSIEFCVGWALGDFFRLVVVLPTVHHIRPLALPPKMKPLYKGTRLNFEL